MTRPKDQETIAVEKKAWYTHRFHRELAHYTKGAPPRATPGSVMRQRAQEKVWARAFLVVSMGRNSEGRISGLRFSQFESFQWGLGFGLSLVVWYPALGGLGRWRDSGVRGRKRRQLGVEGLDCLVCL